MLIYAKKKLMFRNPATGERYATRPHDFVTAPDWIEKDPLYAWAQADGSLQVPDNTPAVDAPEPTNDKDEKPQKGGKKEADAK